jgi:hypothetical protein
MAGGGGIAASLSYSNVKQPVVLAQPYSTEPQHQLGLISAIERWYSQMSAIVHGQIPGARVEHSSLDKIAPIKSTQDLVVASFKEGEQILHRLF